MCTRRTYTGDLAFTESGIPLNNTFVEADISFATQAHDAERKVYCSALRLKSQLVKFFWGALNRKGQSGKATPFISCVRMRRQRSASWRKFFYYLLNISKQVL